MKTEGKPLVQNRSETKETISKSEIRLPTFESVEHKIVDPLVEPQGTGVTAKLFSRPYHRLIIDFDGLVELGWPYGYTHTVRLMESTESRSSGERAKGTYKEWVVDNNRKFPLGFKMYPDIPSSPYLWYVDEVLDYFLRFNLLSKRFILYFRNLGLID